MSVLRLVQQLFQQDGRSRICQPTTHAIIPYVMCVLPSGSPARETINENPKTSCVVREMIRNAARAFA